MDIKAIREEIKLQLTGNILELELKDEDIDKIIYSALREIQRYVNSTRLITVPFQPCINLSDIIDKETNKPLNINAVISVYRADAAGLSANQTYSSISDPYTIAQWQVLGGVGSLYNYNDYVLNYLSFNSLNQIKNTTSTELAFVFNEMTNKLYINNVSSISEVTIEYVPRFATVEEIKSDYWIDNLIRLSTALTKVVVGRIRSRYTQSNALWTQDGETLLSEGTNELNELRDYLRNNSEISFVTD